MSWKGFKAVQAAPRARHGLREDTASPISPLPFLPQSLVYFGDRCVLSQVVEAPVGFPVERWDSYHPHSTLRKLRLGDTSSHPDSRAPGRPCPPPASAPSLFRFLTPGRRRVLCAGASPVLTWGERSGPKGNKTTSKRLQTFSDPLLTPGSVRLDRAGLGVGGGG